MGVLSKLGRYEIVRVLGKGAMGTVYEARDPNLERRVAIKTIAVQGLSPEAVADYEARFRTEARSAARLQHPNIVSVYDSGRDGEVAYLVMEYVEGQDLKQHLDRGATFTLEQTLRIMRELLAALAYAHGQNVVHRDVKPANLVIEADGRVKLTDFGVARIQDGADATRTRGTMVGTLKYMSPEQVQGLPVDARADLFSAGIMLYQLLTGRQPFGGDNEFAIIAQIVGVDPPAPSSLQPALTDAVDAVVARALAKSPQQRYADARAFFDDLAQACGQVQDLSTAPMPLGSSSGAGSAAYPRGGSGASGPARAVPTVTQELELVYWKDVRDSDDALDLQGFLDRFPDGIYADLARRRLRQLGVVFIGEQTATRVEPRVANTDAAARPEHARPTGVAGEGAGPQADAAVAGSAGMRRRSALRVRTAAVALLLLAAIAAVWLQAGGDRAGATLQADGPVAPEMPAVQEPAIAVQPAGATAVLEPALASVPAATPAGGTAARAQPADQGASTKARPGLARAAPPSDRGAAATATATAAAARTPPAPTASGADPVPPQPASAEADPEQACAGRVLLGYQICLAEQCAKPVHASHPVCERRHAAEQARKQQQANRN